MKRKNAKRAPITVAPGQVLRVLSKQEVAEGVERWLACFGSDRIGVNTHAYIWHVFSFERTPSVSGQAALNAYVQHEAPTYCVLSNDRDQGFTTDQRPESCSWVDWIVFPPNLAWTMAFTHEDGWLGPYFARSPDYAALHAANLRAMQKAEAAARARRKGWSGPEKAT